MAPAPPRRSDRRQRRAGSLEFLPVVLAASLLAPAVARAADCGYLYDDAFLASMQRTFGQAPPKRSGHVATMAECQRHLRAMLAAHPHDRLLQRTTCVCDGEEGPGGGGGAPARSAPQGGSLGQQLAVQAVSSLLDAVGRLLSAPAGPDGEAVRQQVKAQWEAEERERLAALRRTEQAAFREAQATASAQLAGRPPAPDGLGTVALLRGPERGPAHLGMGKVPPLLAERGLTAREWTEAGAWQDRIDGLRARRPLPAAEARELAALEARRNALWSRAAATPGLSQQDREALALALPSDDAGALVADARAWLEAREAAARAEQPLPLAATSKLVEASVTAGSQMFFEAVGQEGADLAGARLTAAGKKVFQLGDALLVGNALLAAKDQDPAALAGSGASWLLGKVVNAAPTLGPAVGMAQAGGAVVAATARFSIERLVEQSAELVPGVLAPGQTGKDWFDEMKKELPLPQRFVAEGVGL